MILLFNFLNLPLVKKNHNTHVEEINLCVLTIYINIYVVVKYMLVYFDKNVTGLDII